LTTFECFSCENQGRSLTFFFSSLVKCQKKRNTLTSQNAVGKKHEAPAGHQGHREAGEDKQDGGAA
jgi:hypothetical protein